MIKCFWEALEPAELDRYDAAVAELDEQRRQIRKARDLQLERLRYEARLAGELRKQWDEARPGLRRMWDEGNLNNVRKKELLRTVIDKVVLQRPAGNKCEVRIVWRGGDWTKTVIELPVVTYAEMDNGEELAAEVLRRSRAGQSDQEIATELTAAGYHSPLKQQLSIASVRRIRTRHGVLARKAEFLRHGLPGWLSLGQAVTRLGEHTAWAYYLTRHGRLLIERDPEIGLFLVPDKKSVLKRLKELLRGKRFSLTVQPRSS